MKILIISHEYPPIGGGGANACLFLSREFARSGNETTILTAQFREQKQEEITEEGIKLIRVKCRRKQEASSSFGEMLSFLAGAFVQLKKILKKQTYDVCLVFFGIPSGPLAWYLKKRYRIPYIIRSGGGDIPGTQKRFSVMYKFLGPALREIWKNAFSIVVNSEGLKKRAEKFERRYPIAIIENGVDTDLFAPAHQTAQEKQKNMNLLFVSRLIKRKGLQYLIPMLPHIRSEVFKCAGKETYLTVVGEGPYEEQLKQLAVQCGCEDVVCFVGKKEKAELPAIYRGADIFILPSMWEGMPNVVLEAMACGLPIIITPCEGSNELVTDNGFVKQIDDMENAIIELCVNDKLRRNMASKSVKRIFENYQWKFTAEKYLNLFNEIENKNANKD